MTADKLNGKGKSVRGIARDFQVNESTVRRRLGRHRCGKEDGRKGKAEIAAAFETAIQAWMGTQETEAARGRRPAPVKALFEQLRQEGYAGSYKAVLRYVRRRAKAPKIRPVRRVEVKPGTQAQSDWGQVKIRIGGNLVWAYALVVVLSYSRMWHVFWSLECKARDWMAGHLEAFCFLGGVPLTDRHDNLRSAVAQGSGPWAVLTTMWYWFSKQLGFRPDPIQVRTPRQNGKAERKVLDLKWVGGRSILHRPYDTVEDLQAASNQQVMALARQRRHPVLDMSVRDAWQLEKPHLQPLPATLPEIFDVEVRRKVARDCLVSFEGRRYQVSPAFLGHHVYVRGCRNKVQILSQGGDILAVYPRHTKVKILLSQKGYDAWPGDDRVMPLTPLGKMGREIALDSTWTAPTGGMDRYGILVESLT